MKINEDFKVVHKGGEMQNLEKDGREQLSMQINYIDLSSQY